MPTHDLPESELVRLLEEKAGRRRHDVAFDFLGRLSDFRRRVSDEVRQVNVLFPEYTPHDEQYHLKRLFQVADKVLGAERLQGFNASELFVLAAGLYGHDWGMAVSEPEKEFILTGKVSDGFREDELWILSDERQRFKRFAKEQRLSLDEQGCTADMPIELWREYVRQTHAFRSGERALRYFESFDRGVADAVARVSEGHWLDFERLQDYQSYPTDFAVLGEPINLRALAVYVRLIDLLDLAEDRTPYVIWKFVAPRNPKSRMEWAKHRALQPVTPSKYQEGRILVVDGSTDDHEVYAALEDLRRWVDDQFRNCSDVLHRMNNPRHQLDLYRIEWRLSPRGFKPVSIQFEFDRGRMFEILSEEIYQGDPYVFLRELLQNSIDAIRMRREVLERKGMAMAEPSIIRVDVEHGEGGDAVITWRDDGIGMDEYIVQNYLAVAGKSYYRSEDFERERLHMDPIARFGVGILSCFMVADRIEIKTFREPHMPPPAKPLRIVIPRADKQFRIAVIGDDDQASGTTIRIYVEGRKLPLEKAAERPVPLQVTEYLCAIAGFVEFPILIREREGQTLILHPHQDALGFSHLGRNIKVHKLDLSYPWEDVIHPLDLVSAKQSMRECSWNLEDFGLAGWEGNLSYIVLKRTKFVANYRNDYYEISAEEGESWPSVRINNAWEKTWGGVRKGLSPSSARAARLAFYKDGILVANPPDLPGSWWQGSIMARPLLIVNVLGSDTTLDLSRAQVRGEDADRTERLRQSLVIDILESQFFGSRGHTPSEMFYKLAWLSHGFGITAEEIVARVPKELIPLPTIGSGGVISFIFLEGQELVGFPYGLMPQFLGVLKDTVPYFKDWKGGSFLLVAARVPTLEPLGRGISMGELLLAESYAPCKVQFLNPPGGGVPLAQMVWSPVSMRFTNEDLESLLRRTVESGFRSLDYSEKDAVVKLLQLPDFCDFEAPFDEVISYGAEIFNARHPVICMMARIAAYSELLLRRNEFDRELSLYLNDSLDELRSLMHRFDGFKSSLHSVQRRAAMLGLNMDGKISVSWKEIMRPEYLRPTASSRFGLPYEKPNPGPKTPGRRKKPTGPA